MLSYQTLSNGIEVAIKENHFSRTVALQLWVSVGSIHEAPEERGMAHFLEHMLFKGTSHRASDEIAAAVESAGGEVNAYTTFDHTVLHLTLPSGAINLGLEILADIAFGSVIDVDEFEREREVIVEEIRRGLDNPGARIGQKVFELAYEGTEAGRPIIGSIDSVRAITRTQLLSFYRKWYRPDNMTLVIVGDIDKESTYQSVNQFFGSVSRPTLDLPQLQGSVAQKTRIKSGPRASIIKGDWQKPRIELVFHAPDLEHPDTAALDLAAFALGSGELSRLSRRARDRDAVATAVSASVYAPKFGGIFEISAFAAHESVLDCLRSLAREVARLSIVEPVSSDELSRARANLKADRIFRDETVDGQARNLGFGLRTTYKLIYDDIYTAQINSLPEVQISQAIERWLKPSEAMIVALLPNDTTLTENDLLKAYLDEISDENQSSKEATTTATHKSLQKPADLAGSVVNLRAGVRLVYRVNPDARLFTLTAATEGGLRSESASDAGASHMIAAMLAAASDRRGFEEFIGNVEARGASIEGFSGKDSFGFHLQCLPEHAEAMIELLAESMLEPVFPDQQWQAVRRDLMQSLATQDDSPAGICMRKFQELAFGTHPYRYPLYGHKESVASFEREKLLQRYGQFRDAGPWTFAVTGPVQEDRFIKLWEKAFANFHPNATTRQFSSEKFLGGGKAGVERIGKDREQTHIVLGFPGITWGDSDRASLDVLMHVLGGHGGRLFRRLRDQESLAYTVSPLVSYGKHPGVVGSYIACAPFKEDQAVKGLRSEMMGLVEKMPGRLEVERARNYIVGSHEMSLQRSDAQTSTMALMDIYGYGFDDFLSYPGRVAEVTPQAVHSVAERLFNESSAMLVVVGPNMINLNS